MMVIRAWLLSVLVPAASLLLFLAPTLPGARAESICAAGYVTVVLDRATNRPKFYGYEFDLAESLINRLGESVAIACNEGHVCAIRQTSNEAQCVGSDSKNQLTVPTGVQFRQLSLGYSFSAGVDFNDRLHVWGNTDNNLQELGDESYSVMMVSAGQYTWCAIGIAGNLFCK